MKTMEEVNAWQELANTYPDETDTTEETEGETTPPPPQEEERDRPDDPTFPN